jgi:peptidoglycan/LPS O-acetylase OafA/YrhL
MLNNLTGLRFYAAMWVFLYHFFPVYTSAPKINIFEIGFLGVDVFFVLSGFILTYVYFKKFFISKVTGRDYWNFIVKRFAKIYPLHFVITLIFIPLSCVGKYLFHQDSIHLYFNALLQNFLMIHSWSTTQYLSWNFPSWSISAEWFAYLFLFVPLSFIYKFNKIFFLSFAGLVVCAFICYWVSIPDFTVDRYTMNGLPRIIPEFIIGVLTGLIKIKFNLSKRKASLVFIFSLLFLLISFYFDFYFHQLCVIGFAVVILGLSYKTYFDGFFSSRQLIYLGNISFAFYLTQFLSLIIYEQLFRILFNLLESDYVLILQFSMAFSINFIFAALAYKYFEEPMRVLLVKKLIKLQNRKA